MCILSMAIFATIETGWVDAIDTIWHTRENPMFFLALYNILLKTEF